MLERPAEDCAGVALRGQTLLLSGAEDGAGSLGEVFGKGFVHPLGSAQAGLPAPMRLDRLGARLFSGQQRPIIVKAANRFVPRNAMADGTDPSRAVDFEPNVALVCQERFAAVHPRPHTDRPRPERGLAVSARGKCIGGARERHEERVALRVDLYSAVALECLPQ